MRWKRLQRLQAPCKYLLTYKSSINNLKCSLSSNKFVFCIFFFHSQRIQITWQNEMLLLAVVFLHGWLRRALPVSLSQVCLWDVCGRPCWPSRHRKMHNWQRKFNILYLGNERNSGQLGRVGGYLFFFFFHCCCCLGSVWVHSWDGVKKQFFTITADS